MKMNKEFVVGVVSVLLMSISANAKSILTCKDASAPSTRGYFAKSVELKENNGVTTVKTVLAPLAAGLAGESPVTGTTQKVLETIAVGPTSNFILERTEAGVPVTVLVADVEAKKAAILYYTGVSNINMTQFLSCK